MQQHKAQVRKTMRQAASENTFALEELADELKDAKHCLTRATRPHIKSLLASQIRYAAAEELRLLSGDDAPANVPTSGAQLVADGPFSGNGDLGLVACDSPCGRLGVTICYDMRFPELYQKLRFAHGASVLLMPSAFAIKTGEAHWETLLRARAIETQCYVVAAAQAGQHKTDGNCRKSWGHALAFDPWGKCVAKLDDPDGTGVAIFEIDADLIAATRSNMPMHLHRRYDLYGDGPHGAAPEGAAAQGDESMFFG